MSGASNRGCVLESWPHCGRRDCGRIAVDGFDVWSWWKAQSATGQPEAHYEVCEDHAAELIRTSASDRARQLREHFEPWDMTIKPPSVALREMALL